MTLLEIVKMRSGDLLTTSYACLLTLRVDHTARVGTFLMQYYVRLDMETPSSIIWTTVLDAHVAGILSFVRRSED